MSLHLCVCVFVHTWMSVFMYASNTLHSPAYVHTVCIYVRLFTCRCVCLLLYLLQTKEQNSHSPRKMWTLLKSEDVLAGPYNFKDFLGG